MIGKKSYKLLKNMRRKIGDVTVQPDNDQTRGKIAKIGYLLQVTEVK